MSVLADPTHRQLSTWLPVLTVAVAASMLVSLTVGPAHIHAEDVVRSGWHRVEVLLRLAPDTTADPLGRLRSAIVWEGRAPRIVCAAAVGAGLAGSGVVLQAVTRNRLADPYLLGVSSGAAVGAVAVVVFASMVPRPLAAFVGALAALALMMLFAGPASLHPGRVVLAGVAVAQGASALVSLIIFTSAQGDAYREVIDWLMGSVAGTTWPEALTAAGGTSFVMILLCRSPHVLDAFILGETSAYALGIHVVRTRLTLLVATALLVACLVSVSGAIGFVGLVLPHVLRLLGIVRARALLPLAGLAGAVYLVWADTIARVVIAPRELPVGIVTAALGVPAFAWLLGRRHSAALL